MSAFGFFLGAGVGIAGTMIATKGGGNAKQTATMKQQLDEVLAENEKLRRRYKETERHNEDIMAELEKLQRQSKNTSDDNDDLRDDLDDALRKNKKLAAENAELNRLVNEYKTALAAAQK